MSLLALQFGSRALPHSQLSLRITRPHLPPHLALFSLLAHTTLPGAGNVTWSLVSHTDPSESLSHVILLMLARCQRAIDTGERVNVPPSVRPLPTPAAFSPHPFPGKHTGRSVSSRPLRVGVRPTFRPANGNQRNHGRHDTQFTECTLCEVTFSARGVRVFRWHCTEPGPPTAGYQLAGRYQAILVEGQALVRTTIRASARRIARTHGARRTAHARRTHARTHARTATSARAPPPTPR